jgi:hypothetical protein
MKAEARTGLYDRHDRALVDWMREAPGFMSSEQRSSAGAAHPE